MPDRSRDKTNVPYDQALGPNCLESAHMKHGACCHCCMDCNFDTHRCHFCGTDLYHNSYEDDDNTQKHFLSDCRPDLIDGSYFKERGLPNELYKDGPMV